ncbi:GAF domain-containing sensor histidine kinase [Bizionia paragorgiae]|uniref:sensor histidine kinase n=1 Tax=Bizionia paragorgiae TaxID=283786 RepID=UPI00299E0352|nr:GAF domain-containing sensor histidine kinase [Bizionia paragorgiae]MDX1271862.1 GAF domain-containing sensor histidine kinase [Bizionia paragorgiae]
MIAPEKPSNESARLAAVYEYKLIDTLPESDFDNITSIIAAMFDIPMSLITLLDADRNFLKSHFGVPFNEAPRDLSFCGHAIMSEDDIFIIEDSRKDERFHDNPIVKEHQAIFYAGVPLMNPEGFPLGTLCVFDTKPRQLTALQKQVLIAMAKQVVNLFELRKRNNELRETKEQLNIQNENLKHFAGHVSHDMKMPLANMIVTTDILKKKYKNVLDAKGIEYLDYLKQSSFTLSDYISGLLDHYESDKLGGELESFDLNLLLEEIVDLLNINIDCEINFPETNEELFCNRAALEQVFLNLIGNSLKYNDKEKIVITIACKRGEAHLEFKISDNGIGIPQDKQKEIFNLFSTVGNLDRNGNRGNGIGLSTVQKLITKLGGTISLESELGKGTTFNFTIAL